MLTTQAHTCYIYIHNASDVTLLKGVLADDVALLTTPREAAEQAMKSYDDITWSESEPGEDISSCWSKNTRPKTAPNNCQRCQH